MKQIQTTYADLHKAIPTLNLLMQQPLKAANALRVSRLVKRINTELETFREQHIELLKKHGAVEDEQGGLKAPEDTQIVVENEFDEMLFASVDLQMNLLPTAVLDGVEMKPADMMALDFLFE